MTSSQRENLCRMRENGKSYSQIACTLGVSENTVKSFCRRANVLYMPDKAVCPCCGKPVALRDRGKPRRFCSDACRYSWSYAHRVLTMRNAVAKRCCGCKREFLSYPSSHRKYCSHGCYIMERYGKEGAHEKYAL